MAPTKCGSARENRSKGPARHASRKLCRSRPAPTSGERGKKKKRRKKKPRRTDSTQCPEVCEQSGPWVDEAPDEASRSPVSSNEKISEPVTHRAEPTKKKKKTKKRGAESAESATTDHSVTSDEPPRNELWSHDEHEKGKKRHVEAPPLSDSASWEERNWWAADPACPGGATRGAAYAEARGERGEGVERQCGCGCLFRHCVLACANRCRLRGRGSCSKQDVCKRWGSDAKDPRMGEPVPRPPPVHPHPVAARSSSASKTETAGTPKWRFSIDPPQDSVQNEDMWDTLILPDDWEDWEDTDEKADPSKYECPIPPKTQL